jgi:hypothetical protein
MEKIPACASSAGMGITSMSRIAPTIQQLPKYAPADLS